MPPAELFTDREPADTPHLFTDLPASRTIPRSTVNLISSDNGVGLTADMDLLQDVLENAGYDVARVNWRSSRMRECGTAVFLELFNPRLLRHATRSIGLFNMEWFLTEWRRYLPRIDQLWAKSREAEQIFRRWGHQPFYTGFLSRDLYDPSVKRSMSCFHLRGKSDLKNTEAVLEAWASDPALPPLTVVSATRLTLPTGVTQLPRITAEQLRREANTHRIHICPSRTEGWGHYITEGLSTGAAIVTTDASPMNEHVQPGRGILLPPVRTAPRGPVTEHFVEPAAIARAVHQLTALGEKELDTVAGHNRAYFRERNRTFTSTALTLLEKTP